MQKHPVETGGEISEDERIAQRRAFLKMFDQLMSEAGPEGTRSVYEHMLKELRKAHGITTGDEISH